MRRVRPATREAGASRQSRLGGGPEELQRHRDLRLLRQGRARARCDARGLGRPHRGPSSCLALRPPRAPQSAVDTAAADAAQRRRSRRLIAIVTAAASFVIVLAAVALLFLVIG